MKCRWFARWFKRREPVKSEATLARERAEEALDRTKAETPMYRALGESLRELREANHFAHSIQESMRPR